MLAEPLQGIGKPGGCTGMARFKLKCRTEGFHAAFRIAQPQAAKPMIDMEITINPGKAARDDVVISRAGALDITRFQ